MRKGYHNKIPIVAGDANRVSTNIYYKENPDVPKTFISDMSFLSRESLLSVLNALHDYSGGEKHYIYMNIAAGTTLTEEDGQIASNKNWDIRV